VNAAGYLAKCEREYIASGALRIEVSKPENVCSGWLRLMAEGKETR